ncbi:MAG: DUF6314 family protein [Parvularculaceae bacterium]
MSLAAVDNGAETLDWRGYFAGAWRMTRVIDDQRGGRLGEAIGEAGFGADPGDAASLLLSETLVIDFGGRRWPGRQDTIWRFYKASGPHLFFSDGRFFCAMRFARCGDGWRAEFEHLCSDDLYQGVAAVAGSLAQRGWDRAPLKTASAMAIGNVLIYVPGLFWLGYIYGFDAPIFKWGFYPFLIGDAAKLALAMLAFPLAWRAIDRMR